tara:strand:- start:276 stop:668 length:393 start_codon:yes stop_codon:yes gene_type:complete
MQQSLDQLINGKIDSNCIDNLAINLTDRFSRIYNEYSIILKQYGGIENFVGDNQIAIDQIKNKIDKVSIRIMEVLDGLIKEVEVYIKSINKKAHKYPNDLYNLAELNLSLVSLVDLKTSMYYMITKGCVA